MLKSFNNYILYSVNIQRLFKNTQIRYTFVGLVILFINRSHNFLYQNMS